MDMHDKLQAAASAVPVSATGASVAGLSLQEWMYSVTILWVLVQAGFFAWDRIKKARKERDERQEGQGNRD